LALTVYGVKFLPIKASLKDEVDTNDSELGIIFYFINRKLFIFS